MAIKYCSPSSMQSLDATAAAAGASDKAVAKPCAPPLTRSSSASSASSASPRSSACTTANTSSVHSRSLLHRTSSSRPPLMDASQPLLGRPASSSGGSAHGSPRWRHINAPHLLETVYNAGTTPPHAVNDVHCANSNLCTVLRNAPARVVALGGVVLTLGVLVLVHTQQLSATAGLPVSAIRSAADSGPVVAGAANCTTKWFEQRVDHFAWLGNESHPELPASYSQRYLVNDQFWDAADPKATVFFYTGNEGDVTMYADHTGLMWEHAQAFKALIVFAEHRYYGESLPFGPDHFMDHLAYLSHDQALADYTQLLYFLQTEYEAFDHPVIAFGGSYGGMLSAWMRIKYPTLITGAIAASAPILGFPGFNFDGQSYWQVVTRDATAAAGAAANCAPNVRKAWPALFELAKTDEGRANLSTIFQLCEPLKSEEEGEALATGLLVAFDTLAMGNFPYPSSYMTSPGVDLPAWPVRVACSHLADKFEDDVALLEAVRDASNVYYNASKDQSCFKLPTLWDIDGIWDYQYCTELLPQETYFSTNGESDMFWQRKISLADIHAHCQAQWNVTPADTWIRASYGDAQLRGVSNIVLSNGMLDPWSAAGVAEVPKGSKVTVLPIADGAHHLDLFFTRPEDPSSVTEARKIEVAHMRQWVDEFVAIK